MTGLLGATFATYVGLLAYRVRRPRRRSGFVVDLAAALDLPENERGF